MSTRFTWLLGVVVLLAIGLLVACGSHYSASSDGLILVPSQGSAVIQTFSFNLSNGHVSAINSPPPTQGQPSSIVLDPAGAFAYVLITQSPAIANSKTVIASFKVNSNGTLSAVGTTPLNPTSILVSGNHTAVPVVPLAFSMDSSGKFLFVADQATSYTGVAPPLPVPGTVSVLSIGGGASLSEIAGSPFSLPSGSAGNANPSALAVTPTVFPSQNASCSGHPAPTSAFLYVTDAQNDMVWDFGVDMSSGALGIPHPDTSIPGFRTGTVPSGVAVDPCNRFVYVSNQHSNNVSAYSICNSSATAPTSCLAGDGSLVEVSGSPYPALNGPGPMAIDPLANFVYVVDTASNQISGYKISQVMGTLTPLAGSPSTGSTPVAIAIRGDDNWLFVANNNAASLSQFAITPATGALTPAAAGITTDNFPSGVAVK